MENRLYESLYPCQVCMQKVFVVDQSKMVGGMQYIQCVSCGMNDLVDQDTLKYLFPQLWKKTTPKENKCKEVNDADRLVLKQSEPKLQYEDVALLTWDLRSASTEEIWEKLSNA